MKFVCRTCKTICKIEFEESGAVCFCENCGDSAGGFNPDRYEEEYYNFMKKDFYEYYKTIKQEYT